MKNLLTKDEEDEVLLLLNWFIQKAQIANMSHEMDIPMETDKKLRKEYAELMISQINDSLGEEGRYPDIYDKMLKRVKILILTERSLDEASEK
jgi:hypothetical protein